MKLQLKILLTGKLRGQALLEKDRRRKLPQRRQSQEKAPVASVTLPDPTCHATPASQHVPRPMSATRVDIYEDPSQLVLSSPYRQHQVHRGLQPVGPLLPQVLCLHLLLSGPAQNTQDHHHARTPPQGGPCQQVGHGALKQPPNQLDPTATPGGGVGNKHNRTMEKTVKYKQPNLLDVSMDAYNHRFDKVTEGVKNKKRWVDHGMETEDSRQGPS